MIELKNPACRDRTDVNWFPHPRESAEPAIAVCRTCPEIAECAAMAKRTGVSSGVWGGRRIDVIRDARSIDVQMDRAEQALLALTRNSWSTTSEVQQRTGMTPHIVRSALGTLLDGGAVVVRRARHGQTKLWKRVA